ncbi:pyridoxamine 5'-phosphate oxidase [Bacteroidota bacterium]
MELAVIRREYRKMSLSRDDVDSNPFVQFQSWLSQALDAQVEDASAMSVSTVSATGFPSSRMVLLKELDENGFVFFTNYQSRKGKEIMVNDRVALLFYWKELERQVRVSGIAHKISSQESAAYFYSRPLESQISAVISPQSEPIPNRLWLESTWKEANRKFETATPAIPETWGGYRVVPVEFEFFQGREHRLHDRIRYTEERGEWLLERLAP